MTSTRNSNRLLPSIHLLLTLLGLPMLLIIITSAQASAKQLVLPSGQGEPFQYQLSYSTFLGGSSNDWIFDIAIGPDGSVYLTGSSNSPDLPMADPNRFAGGGNDAFVTKLTPDGQTVIYTTFLGGTNGDAGQSIAVTANGEVVVAGYTYSPNFLAGFNNSSALQPTIDPTACLNTAPCSHGFLVKLNTAGDVIYHTYLAGSQQDAARDVALDVAGNIIVAGATTSSDFLSSVPADNTSGTLIGPANAFILKLSADGTRLLFKTWLGGGAVAGETPRVAVHTASIYVVGAVANTLSTTPDALYPTYRGGDRDAFIARLNPNSGVPTYVSYLGGSGDDQARGVAVDSEGNVYLTGWTTSDNFPTANAYQTNRSGSYDLFITKLAAATNALLYSTYVGGSGTDHVHGIAVNERGEVSVVGNTFSSVPSFPVIKALQRVHGDNGNGPDAFVIKLASDGSAPLYSTFLGGNGLQPPTDTSQPSVLETGYGVTVDSTGNVYVGGGTYSANFSTANAPFGVKNGFADGFIAKIGAAGVCDTVVGISIIECEALVKLYDNTKGTQWITATNWLNMAAPCSWYGVGCTAGQVTNLILPANNLSGTIPSELGNLSQLQELWLYNNGLSGAIPSELDKLTNLVSLILNSNKLEGPLPPTLVTNLSNLKMLIAPNNNLSGTLPLTWTLGNLEALNLAVNNFTGPIPTSIGSLTKLQSLRLYNNQLSGPIPVELGNLSQLQELWLYNNGLSGAIPDQLGNLTNLVSLILNSNKLEGPLPPTLVTNLSNLKMLIAPNNNLSGTLPLTWTLGNLEALNLAVNNFTGPIPTSIGSLTKLQSLRLYNNQLSGPIPVELGNLSQLQELWLYNNGLSGAIPDQLGNLTNLLSLILNSNKLEGPLPPTLVTNLSNLKMFIAPNNNLSGTLPLTWTLPALEALNLAANNFTGPIPASLGSSTKLQSLRLYQNQLEGSIPVELGNLKQLRELWLYSNDLLSPTSCEFTSVGRDITASQPLSFTLILASNRLSNVPPCVSDFFDTYDSDWAGTQRSPVYIEAWNQSGSLAGSEVYIIRNDQVLISTTTDANGFAFANTLANAMPTFALTDEILILSPISSKNSAKLNRATDWAYKLFDTNRIVAPDGKLSGPSIGNWGKHVVTLQGNSPLILFNLVVSVERPLYDQPTFNSGQTPPYITTLTSAFRDASNFLYESTDGKFALGQVTIYEGGRQWHEADIHFLTTNDFTPVATVRGMREDVAHVDLGLHWDRHRGQTAWDQSDGFRTIVHELGHYLFNLLDSYADKQAPGRYDCITIMSWPYEGAPKGAPATAFDIPLFSMRNLSPWNAACEQTDQFKKNNGQSDWQTIQTTFSDTLQIPLPTVHLPGPQVLPNYPKIVIHRPASPVALPVKLEERSVAIPVADGQGTQIYIRRNNPTRLIKAGTPDANGQMQLPDVQPGDRILVLSATGMFQGSVEVPATGPIPGPVVQPAVVNPTTDHQPIPGWGGLNFGITATDLATGTIQGLLTDAGGNLIATVDPSAWFNQDGDFVGAFDFGGQKIKSGYIHITAKTTTGEAFELITNFGAADLPTSDIREHVPTVLASFDGNFQLEIPTNSIPTDTLPTDPRQRVIAMVMPVQGVKPVTNVVEAAAMAESGANLPLPQDLGLVGALYNVRASHGITTTAAQMKLTLYYPDETARRYNNSALTIYYWNEETRNWEPQDSVFLENSSYGQAVTAQINRFGIYGLMVKTIWPLQSGHNAVISPLTVPIPVTTALADCNGKYEAVYYQTGVAYPGDAWQKYVAYVPNDPAVPAYINDLATLAPGQTYQIIIKPGESCTIDFSKMLPELALASAAARSFIPVAGELPTLPVGFYGVVPSGTATIEICPASGACHVVTEAVILANEQLAYTVDVDVKATTEHHFTITATDSNGQVLRSVQATGMAGVTKRQDLTEPAHVLFLPVVARSTGTE